MRQREGAHKSKAQRSLLATWKSNCVREKVGVEKQIRRALNKRKERQAAPTKINERHRGPGENSPNENTPRTAAGWRSVSAGDIDSCLGGAVAVHLHSALGAFRHSRTRAPQKWAEGGNVKGTRARAQEFR